MKAKMVLLPALSALLVTMAGAGRADEGVWTQTSPSVSPSARAGHAAASIGAGKVLVFGGYDGSGPLGDTWLYDRDNDSWTQKQPATSPPAQFGHAMADLGGGKVVLFGSIGLPAVPETWVYDLGSNTWTQKFPASSPSARWNHAMASLGGGKALLFGGTHGGYSTNDETWVYDGGSDTWTQKTPAVAPAGRYHHAMAYAGGGKAVLLGGTAPGQAVDSQTWIYDGGSDTWTARQPTPSPGFCVLGFPRWAHAMAQLGQGQVALFGGHCLSANDTWVYDLGGDAWTLKSPTNGPSARVGHAMAALGAGQALLFGGTTPSSPGTLNAQTWVYTDLAAALDGLDLPAGVGTSLLSKLQRAVDAANAGDTAVACSTLRAFVNEVNAQTGKTITSSQAADLLAAATDLMTSLGCTR